MTIGPDILSGYLDGELSPEVAQQLEVALAADPNLCDQLEHLRQAEAHAQKIFDDMLAEPVPLELAAVIKTAPSPTQKPANENWSPSRWLAAASVAVALIIGGVGGYMVAPRPLEQGAAVPVWLADIADYHLVYAQQGRHLVEVDANEADHIQTWLSNTIGAAFEIPDLSSNGLTFEGGRLLVAAGKPVAQLMFTDASGAVVALCLMQSENGESDLSSRTINDLDLLSWNSKNRNIVVIGDSGRADLTAIARVAAQLI